MEMKSRKENTLMFYAIVIASLLGTFAFSIVFSIFDLKEQSIDVIDNIKIIAYIWPLAAYVGVLSGVIGGMSAYLFLKRYGLFNWASASSVGGIIGYLVSLTIDGLMWICIAVGAGSAFFAWGLYKYFIHATQKAS